MMFVGIHWVNSMYDIDREKYVENSFKYSDNTEINWVDDIFMDYESRNIVYNYVEDSDVENIESNDTDNADNAELENSDSEVKEIDKENLRGEVINVPVLFLGNSLVEGFRLYTDTDDAFLCKVGITVFEFKDKFFSDIEHYSCDVVVIEMGTNELGMYTENNFKKGYIEIIDKVRSVNSNAVIYCVSIPPVSYNMSSTNYNFNNSNVKKYNGYIQDICSSENVYYINSTPFFGEVLNSNITGDGIHLNAKTYQDWFWFIKAQLKV